MDGNVDIIEGTRSSVIAKGHMEESTLRGTTPLLSNARVLEEYTRFLRMSVIRVAERMDTKSCLSFIYMISIIIGYASSVTFSYHDNLINVDRITKKYYNCSSAHSTWCTVYTSIDNP